MYSWIFIIKIMYLYTTCEVVGSLSAFHVLSHLILSASPWDTHIYGSYFTDEEMDGHRG